ncbi:lysoplasmalogenase, partial [Candidatus Sumerlaeota bacterium]|nr:lysoplasmalogenase [Candidatus Sumerlaeota bacterium]
FAASAMQLDWVAVPAKLIPMACLIALLPVWSSMRDLYQRAIMAGFIFSGIGDYFMARTDGFILGLSSFLVAHLCYITAFSSGGARLHPLRLIPFVAVGVGIMSVLWPNLGDLKIPVLFYVGAILTMGWRAAARVGHEGDLLRMQWAGLLGAASFILSDSLIAFDKFHQAIPAAHLWIMLTYWAGQIGIACSVRRNDIQF